MREVSQQNPTTVYGNQLEANQVLNNKIINVPVQNRVKTAQKLNLV